MIMSSAQWIAHIALVVADYDEAIEFYTKKLNFKVVEDTRLSEVKRWVLIAPPGAKECCLLLAKAADEKQKASIGNQSGGRVFLFLHTNDFDADYRRMVDNGIHFVRKPAKEVYGTVAVFEDLYGNLWDLIEPTDQNKGNLLQKTF
jgi:catechol 2,3-dioxygenase-like lactoylglutathione lyase family enzyme